MLLNLDLWKTKVYADGAKSNVTTQPANLVEKLMLALSNASAKTEFTDSISYMKVYVVEPNYWDNQSFKFVVFVNS